MPQKNSRQWSASRRSSLRYHCSAEVASSASPWRLLREVQLAVTRAYQEWALDFVHDAAESAKKFRVYSLIQKTDSVIRDFANSRNEL